MSSAEEFPKPTARHGITASPLQAPYHVRPLQGRPASCCLLRPLPGVMDERTKAQELKKFAPGCAASKWESQDAAPRGQPWKPVCTLSLGTAHL